MGCLRKIFQATLLSKVQCDWSLTELLAGIYVADDLTAALALSANLTAQESVITRDGIWLGRNWLRIAKNADIKVGVIQRERELHELNEVIANLQTFGYDKRTSASRGATAFNRVGSATGTGTTTIT